MTPDKTLARMALHYPTIAKAIGEYMDICRSRWPGLIPKYLGDLILALPRDMVARDALDLVLAARLYAPIGVNAA